MSNLLRTFCAGFLLATVSVTGPAQAEETERALALRINRANDLLRRGDVDAAISSYHEAQVHSPERTDLAFNLAVAQYRKCEVAAAQQLFQSSAASENDALAAKARYNLGNCEYASALKIAKSDQAGAIKGLDRAIANYRSALDVDPHDTDARTNLELAAKLRDKLRQQQSQQQLQQPPQQRGQKQQQSQDRNGAQQPDQSASQSQQQQPGQQNDQKPSQANQKEQSSPSANSDKHEKSAATDNQQQNKSETGTNQSHQDESKSKPQQQPQNGQTAEQNRKPQPSGSKDQARPQSQDAANESANVSNHPKSQSPQPQKPQSRQQKSHTGSSGDKPEASPEVNEQHGKSAPKGALGTVLNPDKDTNSKERPEAIDLDAASDGPMTRQEADKMLQSIRDRDMIRRLQRQSAERARRVPVDRDW